MPGSTITSVLNAPYLSPWSPGVASNNVGGITVTSHPFTTGDVIYIKLFINAVLQTTNQKYFVIVDSPTQLRYASSFENAIAGTALSIPQGLTANQSQISNQPVAGVSFPQYPYFYIPSTWMSSSRSTVSFASTDNVQIDFTFSQNSYAAAVLHTGIFGATNSYVLGFAPNFGGIFQASGSTTAGINPISINFLPANPSIVSPNNVRFTLQNSRVSLAVKLTDGSYLTAFTGSLLATSTPPLFFSICLGINGNNVNNCTITYL